MDFLGEGSVKNLNMIPGPEALGINNSTYAFMLT